MFQETWMLPVLGLSDKQGGLIYFNWNYYLDEANVTGGSEKVPLNLADPQIKFLIFSKFKTKRSHWNLPCCTQGASIIK